MKEDAWSLYWQADHQESCIASTRDGDAEEIRRFWAAFAGALTEGAQVLDLATGNGVVPRHLRAARPDLRIVAVDRAAIDPLRFLSEGHGLDGVDFRGRTDITALPFNDAAFDAVTSQFGLEYAPLEPAVAELARVLRPGGKICLLLHHRDSEILRSSLAQLGEIDALLGPGGVIECLARYVRRLGSAAELDQAGKDYLASPLPKSRHVSGQIFTGVNQVIELLPRDAQTGAGLAAGMEQRLGAEQVRLRQLAAAALDQAQVQSLAAALRARGLPLEEPVPLTVGGPGEQTALVGWHVRSPVKSRHYAFINPKP